MPILPPKVIGPLSECSRSVVFENAIPGAKVVLLCNRNGDIREIGSQEATQSSGTVTTGKELLAGDLISFRQTMDNEVSDLSSIPVEVQKSVSKFNPPQVLSHLYRCSRGFIIGAMRPGTRVEVLKGTKVLGTGEATYGEAYVSFGPFGLNANAGETLTVRQRVCPKPPPPGGAPEWIVDHPLPPVEEPQVFLQNGIPIPAPTITKGLTACSRAIEVSGIIPGAEVIVENSGRWSAWLSASDQTVAWLPLPIALTKDEKVTVRQEYGCETQSERRNQIVGSQEILAKPQLGQIDCNTSPEILVSGFKSEANVEIEVVHQGQTKIYRTVATVKNGTENKDIPLPAPPMPVGATIRVRQGECNKWSDWSEPPITANAFAGPIKKPRISADLFRCQNTIPVENLFPLGGLLTVISAFRGPIFAKTVSSNSIPIHINPSLDQGDNIFVEYSICGFRESSYVKNVQPLFNVNAGEFVGPLVEGDTTVTVKDVTAGAYVELWIRDNNGLESRNQSGYAPLAPLNDNGKVSVTFTVLQGLAAGSHVYMKIWHCSQYGLNEGLTVEHAPPHIFNLFPPVVEAGADALTLRVLGALFRSGAKISLDGLKVTTTLIGNDELRTDLLKSFFVKPRGVKVKVVNPDNKESNEVIFNIKAVPGGGGNGTPPPPLKMTLNVGFGSDSGFGLEIQSVTFHVTPPSRPVEILNGNIVAPYHRNATAVFDRINYPNGTYHVEVPEVQFTYSDAAGGPIKTSSVGGVGVDVLLAPGFPSTLNFSIDLDNINPTRFKLNY